jgi:Na+-translocating ferredoxin:NAD+ oxidoreductase subunit G
MKNSNRNEMITPTLVLVLICLVITAALAVTYQVTKPIIEEINIKNANIARGEVLPEGAGGFSMMDVELVEGVVDVYKADNGAGMTITVMDKGYGGKLTAIVGINPEGEITGLKVTKHSETPGLGTKAMAQEYLYQYVGKVAITRTNETGESQIDGITGATLTSNAIYRATETALAQYELIGGAK